MRALALPAPVGGVLPAGGFVVLVPGFPPGRVFGFDPFGVDGTFVPGFESGRTPVSAPAVWFPFPAGTAVVSAFVPAGPGLFAGGVVGPPRNLNAANNTTA